MKKFDFDKSALVSNLTLLSILTIVIATISIGYVSNDEYIYFWDTANYHNQSVELANIFRSSIVDGFNTFFSSLGRDYNQVPCLPIVPIILIFGDSRLVFITGLALLYILPFSLSTGVIVVRLLNSYSFAIFWMTAFSAILMPPVWNSILVGYPGIGGAAIMNLAILTHLRDPKLSIRWQIPLTGLLLSFAILFRRYYAYNARAFLAALFLEGLILSFCLFPKKFGKFLRRFLNYELAVVLISLSCFLALTLLSPEFINRVINTDFSSLYASYQHPVFAILGFYAKAYGWVIWLLAVAGLAIGALIRPDSRSSLLFLTLFGAISILDWGISARYIGFHYATQFTVFTVIGIAILFWASLRYFKNSLRASIPILIAAILIFNLLNGLTTFIPFRTSLVPWLALTSPPPPMIRSDYNEVNDLITFLRSIGANNEPIYVAASSMTLNPSIVMEGEKQLFGRQQSKLNILHVPHVDSRDFYPLEALLKAHYLLIAVPFQHHMSAEEQDVVKVVFDAFTETWDISQDFRILPEQFVLEGGVTIHIYERIRRTSLEAALKSLQLMQEKIFPRPGTQSDFLSLEIDEANTAEHSMLPTLYIGPLADSSKFIGTIGFRHQDCTHAAFQLTTLDTEGKALDKYGPIHVSINSSKFSVSTQNENAQYLLFEEVPDGTNRGFCEKYDLNPNVSIE
ncbi:hypothetical protein PN498_22690 [Oscillatoria sp. CS-180]|uniref:hypothetical protein n=1 Tax=Oscillatoria sp. CS-180 TaxID=3021720 RepID=UPI00232BE6B7|nr:hypothetical protein [Oscillatoria sp. CS-180]MDB9528818.1 hypothetical protein [Oscillatoria sp. CS-180]